jgi:hypothetical protein
MVHPNQDRLAGGYAFSYPQGLDAFKNVKMKLEILQETIRSERRLRTQLGVPVYGLLMVERLLESTIERVLTMRHPGLDVDCDPDLSYGDLLDMALQDVKLDAWRIHWTLSLTHLFFAFACSPPPVDAGLDMREAWPLDLVLLHKAHPTSPVLLRGAQHSRAYGHFLLEELLTLRELFAHQHGDGGGGYSAHSMDQLRAIPLARRLYFVRAKFGYVEAREGGLFCKMAKFLGKAAMSLGMERGDGCLRVRKVIGRWWASLGDRLRPHQGEAWVSMLGLRRMKMLGFLLALSVIFDVPLPLSTPLAKTQLALLSGREGGEGMGSKDSLLASFFPLAKEIDPPTVRQRVVWAVGMFQAVLPVASIFTLDELSEIITKKV